MHAVPTACHQHRVSSICTIPCWHMVTASLLQPICKHHSAVFHLVSAQLNRQDVWGRFAPMFHLVDVFAIYAITLVGGRHAILPSFTAQGALLMIGLVRMWLCSLYVLLSCYICEHAASLSVLLVDKFMYTVASRIPDGSTVQWHHMVLGFMLRRINLV